MKIARQAGIDVADFELLPVGEGRYWLQQSRFDCVGETGRLHMVSASGLLDASFRAPSLDYVDLIKATRLLCGVTEARKLLHRALFNYLLVNQDDHAKISRSWRTTGTTGDFPRFMMWSTVHRHRRAYDGV